MNNIADAGIAVNVITGEPDRLVLNIKILYNPLVCDATGSNYIGGGNPVRETVESHLRDLPFNGVFYPSLLEKELMQQSGVQVAVVERAQASVYGQSLTDISVRYQPYMGALQCDVDTDLNVVYESF